MTLIIVFKVIYKRIKTLSTFIKYKVFEFMQINEIFTNNVHIFFYHACNVKKCKTTAKLSKKKSRNKRRSNR